VHASFSKGIRFASRLTRLGVKLPFTLFHFLPSGAFLIISQGWLYLHRQVG
jgi:hypothetical protein